MALGPHGETQFEEGAPAFITQYFRSIWLILTHPREFYQKMPVTGGVSSPLAFALVTHWLGSAISYLWSGVLESSLSSYYRNFMNSMSDNIEDFGKAAQYTHYLKDWFWGAGSVITDPFLTLCSILYVSFLVSLGAKLLVTPGRNGAPQEIRFESALRIICYGMTPAILSVIPLFGSPLAALGTLIVTVIGAQEVYRISLPRAIVVALFPKILFYGTIVMGVLALIFAAVNLLAFVF